MAEGASATVVPLSASEAALHLAPINDIRVLLAVSGGVDSMALMGLAARQAASIDRMTVAVVDHGLRPESADEARFVCEQAARFGLACAVLHWKGEKPATGLQKAARHARYRLLVDHAMNIQADVLVTAHTLDDQAETVMMRMAAGSGVAGLGGMKARTETLGFGHVRPFLSVGKDRLMATCREHGWPWIEDPSNRNEDFARVRWRQLLPLLACEGLTTERLRLFAGRMAKADSALYDMAGMALQSADFSRGRTGWQFNARSLFGHPVAVTVRALELALVDDRAQDKGPEAPQLARIEACVAALREAVNQGEALRRTLGGYVLSLSKEAWLTAKPEPLRRRGCVNRVRKAGLGKALPEN